MALQLCFRLSSGEYVIPLTRIHAVAAYATLEGEPDGYFLGWLRFRGELVPVFDLNRVMCEQPTPESFGSRIILVDASPSVPVAHLGLLAAGVTDTATTGDATAKTFDLALYLPILQQLIPSTQPVKP